MGKFDNVTTLYNKWLKEVKINLMTHSRRVLNFSANLIAPKLARGHNGGSKYRKTTRNETRQGQAVMGSTVDRN
jgi:hypothetical protein